MSVTVLDHPLANIALTLLRDIGTSAEQFRKQAKLISTILAVEASRSLSQKQIDVETPTGEVTAGSEMAAGLVAVPILRAGLGMLEAVLELIPHTTVGYLGLARNETTAEASCYYTKLPELASKVVWMLDPMLATGGSAVHAAQALYNAGATDITLLSIVAAPEGAELLSQKHPNLRIIAAVMDRKLNDRKYILPGLGDFGDRLFGT